MRTPERKLTRRSLLAASAGLALGAACGPRLGGPVRPRRIGYLSTGAAFAPDEPAPVAFREGMRAEGFTEWTDYYIEYRFAASDYDLLNRWAHELVALGAEVIVAGTTGATQAARCATSDVPIVMVASHDPVDAAVVSNLAKPGGNVTGQSLAGATLMALQLDFLQKIGPMRRLGYLSPTFPSPCRGYPSVTDMFELSMRKSAAAVGIDVIAPKMRSMGDVDAALAALTAERVDALLMIESPTWFTPLTSRPVDQVIDFAVRRRLPSISGMRQYAQAGLLATMGDARSGVDLHRSATSYVAKILRGAAPGDLAVHVPTFFELVINAKTASAIGLEVPRYLLDQAKLIIR